MESNNANFHRWKHIQSQLFLAACIIWERKIVWSLYSMTLKKKRSYISDARTDHNCSGRSFPITTIEGIRRPLTGRSVAQSSGLPVHILKDPWASYWNPSNSQHIRLYMSECALEYYCMNLGMSACIKKPFKWSIWLENLNINVCSVEQTRQDKICQMSR